MVAHDGVIASMAGAAFKPRHDQAFPEGGARNGMRGARSVMQVTLGLVTIRVKIDQETEAGIP